MYMPWLVLGIEKKKQSNDAEHTLSLEEIFDISGRKKNNQLLLRSVTYCDWHILWVTSVELSAD